MILIHGFGFGSFIWEPMARRLAPNYKVHPFPLAGYGGNAGETEGPDSERLAAHEDAHWIGWSMGGLVALRALADGLRPRSLTLIAAQPRMVAGDDWPHAIEPAAFRDFRARVRRDRAAAMRHFAGLVAQGDDRARQIRDRLRGAPIPDQATLDAGLDLLERADERATWARCPTPQQCVLGDADALLPASAIPSLRALRPEARIDRISDSGHALPLARPDRCAELARAFWRSLE